MAIQLITWLQPSATFTTRYFFKVSPCSHKLKAALPPFSPMPSKGAENLFFVLHVHVLSVNHAFIFLLARAVCRSASLRACSRRAFRRRLLGFIHGLCQLVRSLCE